MSKLYDKYDRLCFIGLIFDSRSSCQNNIVELEKLNKIKLFWG